jgi:hypothetical protein
MNTNPLDPDPLDAEEELQDFFRDEKVTATLSVISLSILMISAPLFPFIRKFLLYYNFSECFIDNFKSTLSFFQAVGWALLLISAIINLSDINNRQG